MQVMKERKREEPQGGENLAERLNSLNEKYEQLKRSNELSSVGTNVLSEGPKAENENQIDHSYTTKENFKGPNFNFNLQKTSACLQNKDTRSSQEEQFLNYPPQTGSVTSENQRVLFQLNNAAINQPNKSNQDHINGQSVKIDDKMKTEVTCERMKMEEIQGPDDGKLEDQDGSQFNSEISNSGKGEKSQLGSKTTEYSNKINNDDKIQEENSKNSKEEALSKSSKVSHLEDRHLSDAETDQKNHEEDEASDGIPRREVSFSDEESEEGKNETQVSNIIEPDIGTEESQSNNQVQINSKTKIIGEVMLCVVEGENKENIEPIILTERSEKLIETDAVHQRSDETRGPSTEQLMDFDKEPAFVEDNLEKLKSCIIDDEEIQNSSSIQRSDYVRDTEKLIIEEEFEDNITKEHMHITENLDSSVMIENPVEEIRQENLDCKENSTLRGPEGKQLPAQNQSPKLNKEGIKTRREISVTFSQSKEKSNQKSKNCISQNSNLTKRPPILQNLTGQALGMKTPVKLVKKPVGFNQQSNTKRFLGSERSSFRKSYVPSTVKSQAVIQEESVEKAKRKPSVPRFATSTSKSPIQNVRDPKLCSAIVKRQEEAEQVLLLRKPPVPKFSNTVKRKETQALDQSQSLTPRKPPVPKLSELLKKRPGAN